MYGSIIYYMINCTDNTIKISICLPMVLVKIFHPVTLLSSWLACRQSRRSSTIFYEVKLVLLKKNTEVGNLFTNPTFVERNPERTPSEVMGSIVCCGKALLVESTQITYKHTIYHGI